VLVDYFYGKIGTPESIDAMNIPMDIAVVVPTTLAIKTVIAMATVRDT
jgi:hypothetical protein